MNNLLLNNPKFITEKKYWVSKLNGSTPGAYLPTDNAKKAEDQYEEGACSFNISGETGEKVYKMAKKNEQKVFSVLAAAVQSFVYQYDYRDDLDLMLCVPGNKAEPQGGQAKSFIIVRTFIHNKMTFKELLLSTDKTINEANQNTSYPLEKLLENMGIMQAGNTSFLGVALENIHTREALKQLNCDIIFSFSMKEDGIKGTVEYNAALYNKETIQRYIVHFNNVLNYSVGNFDSKLTEIKMLTEGETMQMLVDFNATSAQYPQAKNVHGLFYKQAEKTPDNIAVCFKEKFLTYRELNEKSNKLARYLQKQGISKNSVVGLLVGRNPLLAIGLLALLKAGAAYLPIDPEYPESRVNYIAKESNMKVVLGESNLINRFHINCARMDIANGEIEQEDSCNLENISGQDDLAYIIYTSGSTGKPKGVMIEHKGLLNFVNWCIRELKFSDKDVTLQLISNAFDGFASNFYPGLLTGGKVVIPNEDDTMNFQYVASLVKSMGVTNMSVVPTMYRAMLNASNRGDLGSLRFVVLAGDKTPVGLVKHSEETAPGVLLINVYGPTENSVTTTAYTGMKSSEKILIGKPIFNNKVYVVGKEKTLMPIGVPGELWVSGDGIARGYMNNPGMTAERFLENPFNQGERVYKTGDLARWTEDGNIEFIGRIDNQVKIRGLRIETGEIESLLLQHELIREAIVAKKEDSSGNPYLCAYIVPSATNPDAENINVTNLRAYLLQYMPDYMIPSHFMTMSSIPLTPNGKINRAALPGHDGRIRTGTEYVSPRNAVEKSLAELWAEVLNLDPEKVGINDTFFDLGGNSMTMMEVTSLINSKFSTQIKITDLFNYTTISSIATLVGDINEPAAEVKKFSIE